MLLTTLIATSISPKGQDIEPLLWLNPNGQITLSGREIEPTLTPGAVRIKLPMGYGYSFDGKRGGMLFGDRTALQITESMTISLMINLRSYVNDGPGAQILFRGDDRIGRDPFYMAVHPDGTINFAVDYGNFEGMSVRSYVPLKTWVHIVANYQAETGRMEMYVDGDLRAMSYAVRPIFRDLDNAQSPGFSIGNVQNDRGPHNQPLNGSVFDLRLYKGHVLSGRDFGRPRVWDPPLLESPGK